MGFLGKNSSLLRPLLASVLTVLFLGCQPPKKDDKPAQTSPFKGVSNLSEKATTCENKIRGMMTSKSMNFENVEELSAQVSFANASLQHQAKAEYSLTQTKENTKSVAIEYITQSQDHKQSLEYELSLNSKDSKDPMNVTLKYALNTSRTASELEQRYLINENCELRKSQTSFRAIKKKDELNYTYSKANYYVGGESDNNSENFSIPEGAKLDSFLEDDENVATLNNSYSYSDGIGLMQARIIETSQVQKKKFGLDLNFTLTKASLGSATFNLDIEIAVDEKAGVKYSSAAGQETWIVTQAIWQQQALGSSKEITQVVAVKLPEKYFSLNNTIVLSGKKLPAYDNFGAYWTKSNQTTTPEGMKSVTLTEKTIPTISGTSTAADLVSNSTIQTELPAIQKVAQDILIKEPTNREAQAQLILKYLSENYIYDMSMVENNVVRPLTTEEALTRGKGVCQHYAVIFTAIARAMKIPTRIVVGFHLSEQSAGGHAWNEFEIRKGVWQVVEPQGKTLESTNTRFYLPLIRGAFLEDKDLKQTDWIMEYLGADYSITMPTMH